MKKIESYFAEESTQLHAMDERVMLVRSQLEQQLIAIGDSMEVPKALEVGAVSVAHTKLVKDLFRPFDNKQDMLIHGAVGISGEAGELLDAIKKHVFYDKQIDVENVVEEVGDLLFYIRAVLDLFGYSIEDAMLLNIVKLGKRYPSGEFTTADAQARADKK